MKFAPKNAVLNENLQNFDEILKIGAKVCKIPQI